MRELGEVIGRSISFAKGLGEADEPVLNHTSSKANPDSYLLVLLYDLFVTSGILWVQIPLRLSAIIWYGV